MKSQKELLWKSRRGMKELDILFQHYTTECYEHADEAHQQAFEEMTAMQDPLIIDYLFGRRTPESAEIADIISIMLAVSPRDTQK